ncbi:MAG: hypothetical protein H7X93_13265, partial [Sphingomonadaceae bacterium]|nr:hypothetical protein [Sphingomonadaceae bacterium]
DVVRALAAHGGSTLGRDVASAMSANVVVCQCEDTVDQLMAMMTDRRIRHLLSGGSGNDSYFISLGGDVVHEDEKGGVDKVESAVDHKLGANVENLVLGDAASAAALAAFAEASGPMGMAIAAPARLDGIGNGLANKITGSSGANLLAGKGGNDRLIANDGADVLKGNTGNDQLKGGAGADTLSGGANNDALTGGADADVFAFADVSGRDRITDFVSADGDRIRIDSPAATRFRDLDIASDGNGGSIVEWAGNRITLAGVDSASLRAKHFEFVQQPEAAPLSAFGEDSDAASFAWSPAMPIADTGLHIA